MYTKLSVLLHTQDMIPTTVAQEVDELVTPAKRPGDPTHHAHASAHTRSTKDSIFHATQSCQAHACTDIATQKEDFTEQFHNRQSNLSRNLIDALRQGRQGVGAGGEG